MVSRRRPRCCHTHGDSIFEIRKRSRSGDGFGPWNGASLVTEWSAGVDSVVAILTRIAFSKFSKMLSLSVWQQRSLWDVRREIQQSGLSAPIAVKIWSSGVATLFLRYYPRQYGNSGVSGMCAAKPSNLAAAHLFWQRGGVLEFWSCGALSGVVTKIEASD